MPKKATPKTTVDIWMTVFLSIFGISLFFSGVHNLITGALETSHILGVIAALSGGIVIGISLTKLPRTRKK